MAFRLILIALLVYGAYVWWGGRAIAHAPGVLVAKAPVQRAIDNAAPFQLGDYRITPLARFSLEARVLGATSYRLGREADLSPVDLALGWAAMSDTAVLDRIEISQSNRFYYWRVREFPIPRAEIERNSANMHMIPADDSVAAALKAFRPGQLIAIKGYLVRADASDGWRWVSSLTRSDTGQGACELVWVEAAHPL